MPNRCDFKDPEYRQGYAESYLAMFLPLQLVTLRRQRGMTQTDLSESAAIPVESIRRYETDGNLSMDIRDLLRIARALDVRLKVSFETFGTLAEEAERVSPENLARPTFDQEDQPAWQWMPGPVNEMRRKLIPWLMANPYEMDRLVNWLQGYDLPLVGDEVSPAQWLLLAVDGQGQQLHNELTRRAAEFRPWLELEHNTLQVKRPEHLQKNLSELQTALTGPEPSAANTEAPTDDIRYRRNVMGFRHLW